MIKPYVQKELKSRNIHVHYHRFFLEPVWLFNLPAITLIVGLIVIALFIIRTNAKVAREKAEAALKAAV